MSSETITIIILLAVGVLVIPLAARFIGKAIYDKHDDQPTTPAFIRHNIGLFASVFAVIGAVGTPRPYSVLFVLVPLFFIFLHMAYKWDKNRDIMEEEKLADPNVRAAGGEGKGWGANTRTHNHQPHSEPEVVTTRPETPQGEPRL